MARIIAILDLVGQLRSSKGVEFNYLLLFDHHPDGATAIKELRTDFKNRRVDSSSDGFAPHGYGFAYQWLLLSPSNQSELQFRYLGQQRIDGHAAFVLSFAQIPDQVKEPGEFKWAGEEAPFFFQGIVWIDQSTYDVLRLRTDLLSGPDTKHKSHEPYRIRALRRLVRLLNQVLQSTGQRSFRPAFYVDERHGSEAIAKVRGR